MGKLRFLLALWLAKLSVPALKITRHNGTDFPGSLALKLCPDFLRYVGKPGTIIAVTGTNGKTTVSNLLTDILEADGKKVLSNRSGSNITSGISTALIVCSMPIGSFICSALAAVLPVPAAILASGVLSIVLYLLLTRVKSLDAL